MKWPETSLFNRAVYRTCIIEKLIITHQEPIESIKVWILLGYPSKILGYSSKYCNYTKYCIYTKNGHVKLIQFSIFKITDICLLWLKITIFIIEISLKLHLHAKYGWNNSNSWWLGLKSPKFHFLSFLAVQKFIVHTNIQIHVRGLIFIVNIFLREYDHESNKLLLLL